MKHGAGHTHGADKHTEHLTHSGACQVRDAGAACVAACAAFGRSQKLQDDPSTACRTVLMYPTFASLSLFRAAVFDAVILPRLTMQLS